MKKKLSFSLLTAFLGLCVSALAGCDKIIPTPATSSNGGGETSHSEPTPNPSKSSDSEPVSSQPSQPSQPSESVEVHTHTWGEPEWAWTEAGDSYTTKATFTCKTDSTHKEVVDARVVKGTPAQATCTEAGSVGFTATVNFEGKSYKDEKTDRIDALGHDLVHHDAKAATCTEKGWKAYDTCSRCNHTTYEEIPALGHEFNTVWESDENEHWHVCNHGCGEKSDKGAHVLKTRDTVKDPTCLEEGTKTTETYCEVCGLVIKTEISRLGKIEHVYELDAEKSVAPTCTTGGKRVYTCKLCGTSYSDNLTALGHDFQFVSCTEPLKCSRCEATQKAPGHDYEIDHEHSQKLTCTEDGITRYVCSKCGDSYEDKTPAQGHHFDSEWQFKETKHDEQTQCLDHDIYVNWCENCYQQVERSDDVMRHQYIAKITKNASCVAAGEKQYICKVCGDVQGTEPIAIIPDAHNWDEGTTVGNVTTFHCLNEGCEATKTSVVATEKNIEVSSSDFAAVQEVKLTNAALAFDESSKEMLEGKDLKIEVKETTAGEIYIDNYNYDIPADTKVYDFSLTDNNDNPLAFSEGEGSGKVTVRLPYEIQEGEDADNLVIYYVNEWGGISEYAARYENGFAVFETTHFSYYLVTYMTPEQACAKFGHRYGETVKIDATCLERGYSYEVCSRCGDYHIHDEVAPLGHDFVVDENGGHAATCTEAGYSGVTCSRCHESYGQAIPALGHNYQQKSVEQPTCEKAGKVTYECSECHDTYVQDIPAKGHSFAPVTTPATCKSEGKVEYICKDCGEKDESRTVVLEKLDHEYVLDHETDSEYVYKCIYGCGEEKIVSKNAAPLTEATALHKKVFTNAAISIEGKDLSAHSGQFNFKLLNHEEVEVHATNSEAHIGSDANGNLVVYVSTNFIWQGNEGMVAIYLANNKLYTVMDKGNGTQYQVIDLESISMGEEMVLGDILHNVPELIDYLNTDVKAFLDDLLEFNNEDLNRKIYHALDRLFTFKSTPTGYDIILDFDKVSQFVEKLKTQSIKECVDYLLGDGTVQDLLDDVEEYVTLSLFDALEKLKTETGLDYKELIKLIDKAVKIITGDESLRDLIYRTSTSRKANKPQDGGPAVVVEEHVDIDEYLAEDYLKENSINSLIRDNNAFAQFLNDKTLAQYIKNDIKDMLNKNIFELLEDEAGMPEEFADQVKGYMTDYANLLKNSNTSLVFKLGENGEFQGLNVVLDLTSEDVEISGDLQVNFGDGYRSYYDYDSIVRLADSVRGIVVEDRFSTNEKIMSHFGTNAKATRDAQGNIDKVEIVNREQEYPYGKDDKQQSDVVVVDEQDLFQFVGRSYYQDLVDIYNEYATKGQIIIQNGRYRIYEITDFVPNNLRFYQVCGNKYDYEYYLNAKYTSYDQAAMVVVVNTSGQELYRELLSASSYSYSSSYDYYCGAVDLASNKPIQGGKTNHSYVLVESSDPSLAKCGDKITEVYVCADCGAKMDRSYVKGHNIDEEKSFIKAELVYPNSSCYNGVKVTYKCEDCGEEFTKTIYDHFRITRKQDTTPNGIKYVEEGCLCGQSEDRFALEGYYQERDYTYMTFVNPETEEYESLYCLVFAPKEFDPENPNSYVFVGTQYESKEDCTFERKLIFYEGCSFNEKAVTYSAKEEILLESGTNHSRPVYVKNSLKPVDPTDFSKGFTYQQKCANCGEVETVTADAHTYHELYIMLKDYGYDMVGNDACLCVRGEIEQLYNLLLTGVGYVDYGRVDGTWQCDFDWNYVYMDGCDWEIGYCRRSEPGEDGEVHACNFAYAESHGYIDVRISEHTGARCREIRVGCDAQGQNALFVVRMDVDYITYHNYEDSDPVVKETDNENINVIFHSRVCKVCGETSSGSELKVLEQPLVSEDGNEISIVGQDGLIYHYQNGYYKNLGLGNYYATDSEGHVVKEGHGEIYGGGYGDNYYYYNINQTTRYYGYFDGVQYLTKVTDTTHSFDTNSDNQSYDRENGIRYYYPFEQGDEFAKLFKQITGFDYNLNKYGCYRIVENYNSDGYSSYSLEQFHIEYEFVGEKEHCTEYNEYHCKVCGKTIMVAPEGHKFTYDPQTGYYVCALCGTKSANGYNGEVVLEDTIDLENGKVLIGYCFPHNEKANGTHLDELGVEIFIEAEITGYGYMSINNVKANDVGDGMNGKFEISLNGIYEEIQNNGASIKSIERIKIYFYGYVRYDYYSEKFSEMIMLTPEDLGIDTTRYYVTAHGEGLYGAVEQNATLVVNPSKKTAVLTQGENVAEGYLNDFDQDYMTMVLNGDYFELWGWRSFNPETGETTMYYRMELGYNEETYETLCYYFIEVGSLDGTVQG